MRFRSKKAKALGAVIAILMLLDLLVFGLGTYSSLRLADPNYKEAPISGREYIFRRWNYECNNPSEFVNLPYVYSGTKRDILYLTRPFNCGGDTGELSDLNNAISLFLAPLILADLPLSFVADTVVLPWTIPKQTKKGNIIDPPYFRMGDIQLGKGNKDKAREYYEKGLKVLPKYYGDRSYCEIYPYLTHLDDVLETLAQHCDRNGDYDKGVFYYENLIEIALRHQVGPSGPAKRRYEALARMYSKLGNEDSAAACYKRAHEYSQKYSK